MKDRDAKAAEQTGASTAVPFATVDSVHNGSRFKGKKDGEVNHISFTVLIRARVPPRSALPSTTLTMRVMMVSGLAT